MPRFTVLLAQIKSIRDRIVLFLNAPHRLPRCLLVCIFRLYECLNIVCLVLDRPWTQSRTEWTRETRRGNEQFRFVFREEIAAISSSLRGSDEGDTEFFPVASHPTDSVSG